MDRSTGRDDELLGVEEVAGYLDVQPTTVYRWCRDGRLPCLKMGKAWRIRRPALDGFLAGAERRRTLEDHLRAFLVVPDFVIAVAEDEELLTRLDAAFFKVGEAAGGLLVKFHGGETRPVAALRAGLRAQGLGVEALEAAGRFRWRAEVDPVAGRAALLREVLAAEQAAGRTVWASFDWTRCVELEAALAQQEALADAVGGRAVAKTAVLEAVADGWSPGEWRRAQRLHRGLIRLTRAGLQLSREVPLPGG
jgi:excisionase family DNA binding protein